MSTWGKNYVASKSSGESNGTGVLSPRKRNVHHAELSSRESGTDHLEPGQFHEVHTDQDFVVTATTFWWHRPGSSKEQVASECSTNSDLWTGTPAPGSLEQCWTSLLQRCPTSGNTVVGAMRWASAPASRWEIHVDLVATHRAVPGSYVFLTPTNVVEDYINVVAP